MKQISVVVIGILIVLSGCMQPGIENQQLNIAPDSTGSTNNFYDDAETYHLNMQQIAVTGEVQNPGEVNLAGLPEREVIVKETLISGNHDSFVGAYLYKGYSLYDILDRFVLDKQNKDWFSQPIDLIAKIENNQGDYVIVSWGEIYYPNDRHKIIIATSVTPIVPSKTKDRWEIPGTSKLVFANDLITERNINEPVKITILTPRPGKAIDKPEQIYSPEVTIKNGDERLISIDELPSEIPPVTYPTIFYGRGRGIHSVTPFTGVMINEILKKHFVSTADAIKTGYFIVKAIDGYQSLYTFSEIMNRNDQSNVLLIDMGENVEQGRFRLFTSADFFSDRAIFAISDIIYLEE